MTGKDLADMSMTELFRLEAASQTEVLTAGLLALERSPRAPDQLEACMRAAHSLKGAARIVDLGLGVALAHSMEDCFVAAQEGRLTLSRDEIDVLLRAVDVLTAITSAPDPTSGDAVSPSKEQVNRLVADLGRILTGTEQPAHWDAQAVRAEMSELPHISIGIGRDAGDRAVRVSVDNLNRLLSLAGESLVESRRMKPFAESLLRLKRQQREAGAAIDRVIALLPPEAADGPADAAAVDARRRLLACQQLLGDRLEEVELSDRRSTDLANRLYDQAIACRMRPFADGTTSFPRMVRDLSRSLGKTATLEISGASTLVDRDILKGLEAPLGHLLRNAVDHGIESDVERQAAGKHKESVVRLEARHLGGTLLVVVSDDGGGVDLDRLRVAVEKGGLATAETVAHLSDAELLEFLFLPGFTMKTEITDISGRGVGLDVVRDMIRQVGGNVRVVTETGRGARFEMQLPLTLSVVRGLLVDVGGEPYAFPFAQILRAVKVPRDEIQTLEGRQHFHCDGRQIGLVAALQLFGGAEPATLTDMLNVILVGDPANPFGLVVERFLGGRELVVQPLDPRLGKVKDISAGALMEDGTPVLIVDVAELIISMAKLATNQRLAQVKEAVAEPGAGRKRILVVDDSLTVRELERKLLSSHGYDIQVAVDGMDGWTAVRAGAFDLVITDIDMPRMDGIELVTQVKRNANLQGLPVMIVSYKDRDEDRRRGLEAGADYYLTKASFNDDALINAVIDLIGEAGT